MGLISFQMGMLIWVSTNMESQMDTGNISGSMEIHTRECLVTDLSKGKENGKRNQYKRESGVIVMKENMLSTKRMVKVSLNGKAEIYTKETI